MKDRFEQVLIRSEDIAYVAQNRVLRKTAAQRAMIRDHLQKFCPYYQNMADRLEDYVDMFPIHPAYIDTFQHIITVEKREVLKTISETIAAIINNDVDPNRPGVISYDTYWKRIKENPSLRTDPAVHEVLQKSTVLEDIITRSFPKAAYKPLALQIIYALSVHRLTTGTLDAKLGLTAQNLKDDLCLHIAGMPTLPGEEESFLLNTIQNILRDTMNTVSGQFIEYNKENGQYYLDLKKDIDYDKKIQEKADFLGNEALNRYFFQILVSTLEYQDVDSYVTGHRIYQYRLNWHAKNIFRRGYLFFGNSADRPTAQPAEDFYVYIMPPYGDEKPLTPTQKDEVYFTLKPDAALTAKLRQYCGAKEMEALSAAGETKTTYVQRGNQYLKQIRQWLDEHKMTLFTIIRRIDAMDIPYWVPSEELIAGFNTDQPKKSHGITHVHLFYTKRNLYVLSCVMHYASQSSMSSSMRFLYEQVVLGMAKIARYVPTHFSQVNQYLSGTLYIGSQVVEVTPAYIISNKIDSLAKVFSLMSSWKMGNALIQTASMTETGIPDNSIDYVFTDPPFGGNLNYSELNFLWEAWYRVYTNNAPEAIINSVQKKRLAEYQQLMERCFVEYYRVLKPNHWITVEFHNSQNSVWNAISEAISRAGFIIADVRILDKRQSSFKQIVSQAAVKQDLVISAYKPRESFVREFQQNAGDPEMAWEFVHQHLRNVPITADGNHDGKLDMIAERQDYLLFDRMVAWHIMNGIPVPMDAHTFYEGLRQRFLERDGMFFLPDQVTEYDDKRAHMELDVQQMSFLVTDEKNAIAWLNYILAQGPKTYQEIQPLYLQELHQSKQEKMPELLDMLRENFVQDEKGAWYIPDLNNAADLAKVRRKALLKEFYDSCVPGKGKLKVFRMEAIRAGFDECWKQRDFATIVSVGERLPEAALQEDQTLLMYYDNACSRV